MQISGLILASSSPQRSQLLQKCCSTFQVYSPNINETPLPGEVPAEYVERIAKTKAHTVANVKASGSAILAADTAVVFKGSIIGKMTSSQEVMAVFKQISGQQVEILTGVALFANNHISFVLTQTKIALKPMTTIEITNYSVLEEVLGKAGGLSIQGATAPYINNITGSFTGAIGLPVAETKNMLAKVGLSTYLRADQQN